MLKNKKVIKEGAKNSKFKNIEVKTAILEISIFFLKLTQLH